MNDRDEVPAISVDAAVLYRTARTIRRFEETAEELTAANDIPGTVHLYIGEEAVPGPHQ